MFSISIHPTRSLPPFSSSCSFGSNSHARTVTRNNRISFAAIFTYSGFFFFCCISLVFSIPLFAKSNARAKDLPGVAGERVKPAEAQLANTFCTALSFPWVSLEFSNHSTRHSPKQRTRWRPFPMTNRTNRVRVVDCGLA